MASQKLILLEDVESLGLAGEEVNVANGYARNYLLPKKLATKASRGALRQLESRKVKIEANRAAEIAKSKELATKIEATEVSIPMQASEDEDLFGSVTARSIVDKLEEAGITISSNKIKLDEPIKKLGLFKVEVKLHAVVSATLKVWIVRAEV